MPPEADKALSRLFRPITLLPGRVQGGQAARRLTCNVAGDMAELRDKGVRDGAAARDLAIGPRRPLRIVQER